jgi:hypothetical protein
VPKPRAHLTCYHAVFAPAIHDRAQIVPGAGAVAEHSEAAAIDRYQGMSWAQRPKRVFGIVRLWDRRFPGLHGEERKARRERGGSTESKKPGESVALRHGLNIAVAAG